MEKRREISTVGMLVHVGRNTLLCDIEDIKDGGIDGISVEEVNVSRFVKKGGKQVQHRQRVIRRKLDTNKKMLNGLVEELFWFRQGRIEIDIDKGL